MHFKTRSFWLILKRFDPSWYSTTIIYKVMFYDVFCLDLFRDTSFFSQSFPTNHSHLSKARFTWENMIDHIIPFNQNHPATRIQTTCNVHLQNTPPELYVFLWHPSAPKWNQRSTGYIQFTTPPITVIEVIKWGAIPTFSTEPWLREKEQEILSQLFLVGGFNQFGKYAHQVGSFPQFSGWN